MRVLVGEGGPEGGGGGRGQVCKKKIQPEIEGLGDFLREGAVYLTGYLAFASKP